jgi:hypothetical protein
MICNLIGRNNKFKYRLIDFVPSWWLIIDVNSVLGMLHYVDMANIFEVYGASIFRFELCTLVSCVSFYLKNEQRNGGEGNSVGTGISSKHHDSYIEFHDNGDYGPPLFLRSLNFTGKYNNSQSQQGDGGSLQPRSYNAC